MFCMRVSTLGSVVSTFILLLAIGCGPTDPGGNGDGNGLDGSSGGGDGGGGNMLADADPNQPDSGCGLQEENIELVNLGDPPDMLIVLDRSGSMTQPIDFFNPFGSTRWDVMRDALKGIVMDTELNINWGLSVFPTDNDCAVNPGTEVSVAPGRYTMIKNWLDGSSANGNTPAHLGLQEALTTYQSMPANPEGRFVLWATDGVPNCVDPGDPVALTLAKVTALAASGITTYVIGFGDPLGLDVQLLNDAAQAGGAPKPGGPPYYYEATNANDLQTALDQIAGGVIIPTCSYALQSVPPDPDAVTVKANGVPVPRSTAHTNGWDYYPDAMTITFFGSYCDDIEDGTTDSVEFFFGCPGPIVD